jgi:cyclic beta-1,2-glucan synthetase
VRENGGQYTHSALWVAQAFARRGEGDRAVSLLRMLNPVEHARTPADNLVYKVEPYAVVADVYALEGRVGQGGWTWYTGSCSWMYRVWLEDVLGFKLRGDALIIDPCIRSDWTEYFIRYRYQTSWYDITVQNPDRAQRGVAWVELDGERLPCGTTEGISLHDDGVTHRVLVRLGQEELNRDGQDKQDE